MVLRSLDFCMMRMYQDVRRLSRDVKAGLGREKDERCTQAGFSLDIQPNFRSLGRF